MGHILRVLGNHLTRLFHALTIRHFLFVLLSPNEILRVSSNKRNISRNSKRNVGVKATEYFGRRRRAELQPVAHALNTLALSHSLSLSHSLPLSIYLSYSPPFARVSILNHTRVIVYVILKSIFRRLYDIKFHVSLISFRPLTISIRFKHNYMLVILLK